MAGKWIKNSDIRRLNMINIPGGIHYKDIPKKYDGVDIFSSGTLFVTASSVNFVRFEDENIKDGYLGASKGYGIKNNQLIWCSYQEAYNSPEIRDYVSGFPSLVENGKKKIDWGNKYSSYVDGKHRRNLWGKNSEVTIFYITENKISIDQAADLMVSFGCDDAIACDGGDFSPHLQERNTILYKGSRKNPTWMLVYLNRRKEFCDLAFKQLGLRYVYGFDGEISTPSAIQKVISIFGKQHYITETFDATANKAEVKGFDCSGLIVYLLRQLDYILPHQDYSAHSLFWQFCTFKTRSQLINGDLVFNNNLTHVGIFYDGFVLEAKGTNYGVVLNNSLNNFTRFGRLIYFEEKEV